MSGGQGPDLLQNRRWSLPLRAALGDSAKSKSRLGAEPAQMATDRSTVDCDLSSSGKRVGACALVGQAPSGAKQQRCR